MEDFSKQKEKLLMDDNKKCFLVYGAVQQKVHREEKRDRGNLSIKEKNGRSSWLNGLEDKWQQNFKK